MLQDIYCISGLGADHRIFSRLEVPRSRFCPLSWLTPGMDEPIDNYAVRMQAGISSDKPILLGVSFGGMMALEIAKRYTFATVIIVSSICDHRQLPYWMQISGKLRLNRLVPVSLQTRITLPEKYPKGHTCFYCRGLVF